MKTRPCPNCGTPLAPDVMFKLVNGKTTNARECWACVNCQLLAYPRLKSLGALQVEKDGHI